MRTFVSFRLSRFIRIGLPVAIGNARTTKVPAWVGWGIVALIILAVARGYS